jgi:hypothetical protein
MTISLRRSAERVLVSQGGGRMWMTFGSTGPVEAVAGGFRALESCVEHDLAPGMGFELYAHKDHDMLTYVEDGALTFRDSADRAGILRAGDFRRAGGRAGMVHRGVNASDTERAHVFQSGIASGPGPITPGDEQKRFSLAERRGILRRVASPDGRGGSLRLRQDAEVYSSILYSGTHLVHEFRPGRNGWVHVVSGRVRIGDHRLEEGDGAGLADEAAVSFLAEQPSEILLFDLA